MKFHTKATRQKAVLENQIAIDNNRFVSNGKSTHRRPHSWYTGELSFSKDEKETKMSKRIKCNLAQIRDKIHIFPSTKKILLTFPTLFVILVDDLIVWWQIADLKL